MCVAREAGGVVNERAITDDVDVGESGGWEDFRGRSFYLE